MSETTTLSPKGYSVLGVLIFIWGLLTFIYVGWPSYQTATEAHSWPKVEGTVVESGVAEVESYDSQSHRRSQSASIMYRPEVVFQYTVDGKSYTSNTVYHMSTSQLSTRKGDSLEVTSQYPVGTVVQVYYDANHPQVSVLEPGVRDVQYVFVLGPLILMLIGLHVFINRGLRQLGM